MHDARNAPPHGVQAEPKDWRRRVPQSRQPRRRGARQRVYDGHARCEGGVRLADRRGEQRVVRYVAGEGGGEIEELRGGGGPQRTRRGGEHLVGV